MLQVSVRVLRIRTATKKKVMNDEYILNIQRRTLFVIVFGRQYGNCMLTLERRHGHLFRQTMKRNANVEHRTMCDKFRISMQTRAVHNPVEWIIDVTKSACIY